jgi:hypothetical protein
MPADSTGRAAVSKAAVTAVAAVRAARSYELVSVNHSVLTTSVKLLGL